MSAPKNARVLSLGDLIAMTFDVAEGYELDARTTTRVVHGAVSRLLRTRPTAEPHGARRSPRRS